MELSHRDPYISPMRRKNEPTSVGEQFSAVKTKYWSKVDTENNPKVPGPFVDLRETHRHQNRVQALMKKTELYTNSFEKFGGSDSPTDRSRLPNYNLTSLSPLKYAGEPAPVDFQVLMDVKSNETAQKFAKGMKNAS